MNKMNKQWEIVIKYIHLPTSIKWKIVIKEQKNFGAREPCKSALTKGKKNQQANLASMAFIFLQQLTC